MAWYDFRHSPTPPVPTVGQGAERGVSEIYYASSSDRGRTISPNIRITDRGADRTLGAWKFDSKFNVGVASSNDAVYFAWQDPRNAILDTDAEDVYTAALALDGKTAQIGLPTENRGAPSWLFLAAGVMLGMGLTMVLVWRLRPKKP